MLFFVLLCFFVFVMLKIKTENNLFQAQLSLNAIKKLNFLLQNCFALLFFVNNPCTYMSFCPAHVYKSFGRKNNVFTFSFQHLDLIFRGTIQVWCSQGEQNLECLVCQPHSNGIYCQGRNMAQVNYRDQPYQTHKVRFIQAVESEEISKLCTSPEGKIRDLWDIHVVEI